MCADLKWIWTAGFVWDGPACSQMRFLCVGLPSPTAEKSFDLCLNEMFSVQK